MATRRCGAICAWSHADFLLAGPLSRLMRKPAVPAVPLLDLGAQYRPIREHILEALTRVADSQRFILGPEVDAFEREMAARLEVAHAVAVSSGTDALTL